MDASAWVGSVGALVTLIALYFTRQQVGHAREQTALQRVMHRDAAQPYVWADIRPDPIEGYVFMLQVRNEGPTVATDVRVTFDKKLPADFLDDKRRDVFTMASMPPGREMHWWLRAAPDWFQDADEPRDFEVTVDCGGPFGEVPTLRYRLDLNDFGEVQADRPGSLHGIAKAVDGLTKAVKNPPRRK